MFFINVFSLSSLVEPQYTFKQCTNQVQIKIYENLLNSECRLRYETVDLNVENFKNAAVQVIPSQTVVARCSGTCYSPNHSCHPTKSKMVDIESIVVSTNFGEGFWNTQCTIFQVRQDQECGCSCEVSPEDCTVDQDYDPQACQCVCKNLELRNSCGKNKSWDENTCSCLCKSSLTSICTTGYVYDDIDECGCVLTLLRASPSLASGLTLLRAGTDSFVFVPVVIAALLISIGVFIFLRYGRRGISNAHREVLQNENGER